VSCFPSSFSYTALNSTTFPGYIQWFMSTLLDIAEMAVGSSLDLHIAIFVSLCQPETVPLIPKSITATQPDVHHLVRVLSPHPEVHGESGEGDNHAVGQSGVGMCERARKVGSFLIICHCLIWFSSPARLCAMRASPRAYRLLWARPASCSRRSYVLICCANVRFFSQFFHAR
jgi:hypothetical protein